MKSYQDIKFIYCQPVTKGAGGRHRQLLVYVSFPCTQTSAAKEL